MTLSQKREAAEVMIHAGLSERASCRLLKLPRTSKRYSSHRADDSDLRERIRKLADERRRFGYRRIHAGIREQGIKVNHKMVYRIYCDENLKLRRKRSKKLSNFRGAPMDVAQRPNDRWSLDFVSDTLYSGRRFRTLNVVDD